LLAAQPAPYDALFSVVERSIHEHGELAASALLAELQGSVSNDAGGGAVLSRIAAFHAPLADGDLSLELSLVLSKLRLQAVDDELKQLFELGVDSPDAQRRSRELMETRRRLKA